MKAANDPEYVKELAARLQSEEAQNYPVLAGLEEAWQLLSDFYGEYKGEPMVGRFDGDSPLSSLAHYIKCGVYPPPELLLALANGLEKYFDAGGDVSLDEALLGQKHKKT